jgi:O-antigen ligase
MLFFNDVANLATIKTVINLRPDRLFLPIFLATYALNRRRTDARVRVHPAEWCMLLLLGWSLLSLVIAGTLYHPQNRHLSSLINWIGLPLLTFWCVRRSGLSQRDIALVFRVLIGLGIYLAATAVFEHYRLWALVFPRYISDPRIGIQFGRSRGPFCNSAVMGGVLAIIYFMTLFYINNLRAAPWLRGLLGLLAAAVYFTYTRSAWLALIVSYVVLGLLNARMRRHCATVVVIACLVLLSGAFSKFSLSEGTLFAKRQETVEDRANIMQVTVAMIKDKPFFGFGYGTFQSSNRRYFDSKGLGSAEEGNHNAFTGLLVDLGLLGFVPYVLTWVFLLKTSWHLARRAGPPGSFSNELGAVTVSVLAGYLAGVQFFDPRWFGFLNCLVFFVSGLACAADERHVTRVARTRPR